VDPGADHAAESGLDADAQKADGGRTGRGAALSEIGQAEEIP
jgi:hypothetical protein